MISKKVLIISLISIGVVLVGIGIALYIQSNFEAQILEVEHDGFIITKALEPLYKQYDHLNDVEDRAELIIIGEATQSFEELKQIHKNRIINDQSREYWVDTQIKVRHIIKGVYEENEITIPQPLTDFDVENNHIFTPMGYSPFIENARYVLFLTKSEFGVSGDQEYAWNVISANHGKYNLDGQDHIEDIFSDRKQQRIKRQVLRKYQEWQ
ncbi:hypothetical protein [Bacillus horti]|uniref:Uncharacterized protein n=1 Tax=Caldalkalibacillus horti TaxID=77523 RepID=A0ABT9W121_9BACI|nr:hypothetical protein [Bacillus horti]MDQ0166805.1 hypothetical protein [Bacillus horti]